MYERFESDIEKMNATYELKAVHTANSEAIINRIQQFKKILGDEFKELEDIEEHALAVPQDPMQHADHRMTTKTMLADLLGDIIVYCASEAHRWGIPLRVVLDLIMLSNFSKLGADGKPIKNPLTDKFEKGPSYWKPEPYIKGFMLGQNLDFSVNKDGIITVNLVEGKPSYWTAQHAQESAARTKKLQE